MALVKTYLLTPNFTFRPGGPIALGNIIADPFRPHRVLSIPDPTKPLPAIETTIEYDYTINCNTGRGVSMSVWAQFLETVGGNIGSEHNKNTSMGYRMSALKTSYFRSEPTEHEIHERINMPEIKNVMRFESVRSCPIYMITGIKIAENFAAITESGTQRGGNLGASVPVAEGISLGMNIGLSMEGGQQNSFRSGDDIVFAYQLLEIRSKGWRTKSLRVDEFKPKTTFLGDESEEEDSDIEVEAIAPTADAFSKLDRKEISLKAIEVNNGGQACVFIAFEDN